MYLNKLDLNLVKNKGLPMVSLPRQALFVLTLITQSSRIIRFLSSRKPTIPSYLS